MPCLLDKIGREIVTVIVDGRISTHADPSRGPCARPRHQCHGVSGEGGNLMNVAFKQCSTVLVVVVFQTEVTHSAKLCHW